MLYHSGLSNDVAAVAREIIARDGVSRLALAGFSMGGNIMLKLAGEWGSQAPPQFRAVAACCPALDLAASADALHEPSNRLYETYFLWALRRRMAQKARFFPGHFDTSRLHGIRSLREFDDKITAYYCGFTGVDDYYDRASAAHTVDRIAVPALVLHAANDPFVRITPETRQKLRNPNITFVETSRWRPLRFRRSRQRSVAELQRRRLLGGKRNCELLAPVLARRRMTVPLLATVTIPMDADFSIELGHEIRCWISPGTIQPAQLAYVDVKRHPELLPQVEEAKSFPNWANFSAP